MSLSYPKFKASSAPAEAVVEPGELFTIEHDDEYNGICLTKYTGDRILYNHPEEDELKYLSAHLLIPKKIQGLTVVGVDYDCFGPAFFPNIHFPESVKYFKYGSKKMPAFKDHFTIPNGTVKLESDMLCNCIALKSVTVPEGVTDIGHSAFFYCEELECISVDDNNSVYTSLNGMLLNKDKTVLMKCPMGISGEITIPHGVTRIKEYAFHRCRHITKIHIPDTVTVIENDTFNECGGLIDIDIPSSVTEIGNGAFEKCGSLMTAIIQNGASIIPSSIFMFCKSLANVKLPDIIKTIGSCEYDNCVSLTGIIIPEGVNEIGTSDFYRCKILLLHLNIGNRFMPKEGADTIFSVL